MNFWTEICPRYHHFTDEETETSRQQGTRPRIKAKGLALIGWDSNTRVLVPKHALFCLSED